MPGWLPQRRSWAVARSLLRVGLEKGRVRRSRRNKIYLDQRLHQMMMRGPTTMHHCRRSSLMHQEPPPLLQLRQQRKRSPKRRGAVKRRPARG